MLEKEEVRDGYVGEEEEEEERRGIDGGRGRGCNGVRGCEKRRH